MDIKISHSFVTVDDQEKALAFYRDALGLVVNTDAPLGPYRWLTVSAPGQPGMEIVLATPDMGHGPDDTESLKALLAKGALNENGNRKFKVADKNGAKYTKYVVKVGASSDTTREVDTNADQAGKRVR